MKNFILSWTHCGVGGSKRSPDWQTINEHLVNLESGEGTITLDGDEENGFEKSLQVRFENGMYLLIFGYETEGDWIVKTYQNGESTSEEVTILGDIWRRNSICDSSDIVRQAFSQFFDTGTVPVIF